VLVVAVVAVLLAVTVAAGRLAQAVNERSAAQTAADLAALAGAAAAVDPVGASEPCALAGRVATAHGVRLVACGVGVGGMVTVIMRCGDASADARAGPVVDGPRSAGSAGRRAEAPPAVDAGPAP
jgi:secretion/DNA translocation related TadE-like protein